MLQTTCLSSATYGTRRPCLVLGAASTAPLSRPFVAAAAAESEIATSIDLVSARAHQSRRHAASKPDIVRACFARFCLPPSRSVFWSPHRARARRHMTTSPRSSPSGARSSSRGAWTACPTTRPRRWRRSSRRCPDCQPAPGRHRSAGWPIPQQVDYYIVRAEMSGLDFDHRVLKPWVNNPAFYVTAFMEESDQPAREGPLAAGGVDLWQIRAAAVGRRRRGHRCRAEVDPRPARPGAHQPHRQPAGHLVLGASRP